MTYPKQVVLTSFRDRQNWSGTQFSVARWNPVGAEGIPRLGFLAPMWDGKPMVHLEPADFRAKYDVILARNSSQVERFLLTHPGHDLVFLCWCNPGRQRQYDKLYCHRILIGYYIEKNYPDIKVIYADGAERPLWGR